MRLLTWVDRRDLNVPRAIIQQGRCSENQWGQFSISISNGDRGLTVRLESEQEFRVFLERGSVKATHHDVEQRGLDRRKRDASPVEVGG